MTKYFYDTEFCDNGSTIDLISVGIVAEDGREFYAQNQECDFSRANDWVKANVFPHLECFDLATLKPHVDAEGDTEGRWYTREALRAELIGFCDPKKYGKPEFWGYYSAYDHVVLCQIFGTAMDRPKGWPFYTHDIKQWCDALGNPQLPEQGKGEHHALADARWTQEAWQFLRGIEEVAA
jgi:hypothetical protein